ncbi:MAG: hypothetical protein ABL949_13175 [Fimbriimonadaceae bacterium]
MLASKAHPKIRIFVNSLPSEFDSFKRRGDFLIVPTREPVITGFFFERTSESHLLRYVWLICDLLAYPNLEAPLVFGHRLSQIPHAVVGNWKNDQLRQIFETRSDCEVYQQVLADPQSFDRNVEQTVRDMKDIGLPWLDRHASLEGFYDLCVAFREGKLPATASPEWARFEMAAYAAILLKRPPSEIEEWLQLAISAPAKRVKAWTELGLTFDIGSWGMESGARCKEIGKALREGKAFQIVSEYERESRERLGL